MTHKTIRMLRGLALAALALFVMTSVALAEPEVVEVSVATISQVGKVLAPGESFPLEVLYKHPVNANEPLLWKSDNETVATVTPADGSPATVTAVNDGRTTIRLIAERKDALNNVTEVTLAKCAVVVRTIKVSSFAIAPRKLVIAPGREWTLNSAVRPANATYRTVTWTTSDETVASFEGGAKSAEGASVKLTANKEGQALITASTPAGRRMTCAVTVKNLAVTGVKFASTRRAVFLDEAATPVPMIATVAPATASDVTVKYESDKPLVAEIDENTGLLTPTGVGVATITATAGGKTGKCVVTVLTRDIKALTIKTPDGSDVVLDPNGAEQLSTAATPYYAKNQQVTWRSENAAVATVGETDGLVTAVAGGVTRIFATSAANPNVKAAIVVHVRGDESVMRTVKITAAGDAVLGGDPRTRGAQNPRSDLDFINALTLGDNDGNLGDGSVFDRVAPFFSGDNNITTMNLEGTLTTKRSYGTKPFVFRGFPSYARDFLAKNGVDAVCVANNHSYDVGTAGYNDTKNALKNAGVKPYGNGTLGIVPVASENNLRVAFLGFVSKGLSVGTMRSQIASASKRYDLVVVAFHWTDVSEFRYAYPSGRQRSLSRAAINAGADLVVGHHTHRLNGVERYRGKYIVYDLGNFVTIARNQLNSFLPNNPRAKYDYDSMIYQQAFHVWTDGYVEAADITIIPCSITSSPNLYVNNCQPAPYPIGSADARRILDLVRSHSPTAEYDSYPINRKVD